MSGYGKASVSAARECQQNPALNPADAWMAAVSREFTSEESRKKCCPRGAFLGLCEEGLVIGVPQGTYTTSRSNKAYAISAVSLLRDSPELIDDLSELWRRVSHKKHNQQMQVVAALWREGLLRL